MRKPGINQLAVLRGMLRMEQDDSAEAGEFVSGLDAVASGNWDTMSDTPRAAHKRLSAMAKSGLVEAHEENRFSINVADCGGYWRLTEQGRQAARWIEGR